MAAYDFEFKTIDGKPLKLSDFKGKPILMVNTASACGYTPQYKGLEALWRKYKDRGLVVLGVPSNDFGGQEPGSESEIKSFCKAKFDVTFPMTSKNPVIGPAAHPLYKWIVAEAGEGAAPRWNFHKYLINSKGELAGTFAHKVAPESADLTKAIEAELPR